jgi:TonB family protein
MRTLLVGMLAFLPLVQAQDSRLLKSVEPNYDKYDGDLATDFDVASASVTLTVLPTGKPLTLYTSSVPLPMAVVMALKEYEFTPQGTIPHGRTDTDAGSYQVTLNVPTRQSKNPVRESESAIRVGSGIMKGLLIHQVRPQYPEYARENTLRGTITLDAVINQQGTVESLRISGGPFVLIEAAYDAVKQWQWRPYLDNRQPVEWLTEIQVSFN